MVDRARRKIKSAFLLREFLLVDGEALWLEFFCMRTITYFTVLFLLAWVSAGEDIVTSDGVTYVDARVTRSNPSSVEIVHRSGIATVRLATLPEALQKKYGYDAQKASAFEANELGKLGPDAARQS